MSCESGCKCKAQPKMLGEEVTSPNCPRRAMSIGGKYNFMWFETGDVKRFKMTVTGMNLAQNPNDEIYEVYNLDGYTDSGEVFPTTGLPDNRVYIRVIKFNTKTRTAEDVEILQTI